MNDTRTLNERVADELRVTATRRRLTGADVARSLGEGRVWISRRLNAEVQITVDDLARICGALETSPVAVLDAVLVPSDTPAPAATAAP